MTTFTESGFFTPKLWIGEFPAAKPESRCDIENALELICILLKCCILKIDHKTKLQRYANVLSEKCFDEARRDVENLLYFQWRNIESTLMLSMIHRFFRERRSKASGGGETLISGGDRHCAGRHSFRETVEDILSFLIFRRSTNPIVIFYVDDSVDKSIGSIGNAYKVPRCLKPFLLVKRIDRSPEKFSETIRDRETFDCLDKENGDVNDETLLSGGGLNDGHCGKYGWEHQACKSLRCPLCYGWLWIPIFYAMVVFYRVMVDLLLNFAQFADVVARRSAIPV